MKKCLMVILAIGMLLCLCSCGKEDKKDENQGAQVVTIPVGDEPTKGAEATKKPEETTPTVEPTKAGEITPEGELTPSAEPTKAVNEPTKATEQEPENGSFTTAALSITLHGVKLSVGMDFAPYVDSFSELLDIEEGQACLDGGYDTNYYYDVVTIYTIAKNGKQQIYGINVHGAGASTDQGVVLGSTSEEELFAIYGQPNESARISRVYTKGNVTVTFYVEDEVVTGIDYTDNTIE